MNGTWDGEGRWHLEDKTWTGSGPWEGGMLNGGWKVKGKWEPVGDGIGDWSGEGVLSCNMEFMEKMEQYVILLGSFITIVVSALGYFVV